MEQLREYNKKLLYNILPDHVAQHFLAQQAKKNDVSLSRFHKHLCFFVIKICLNNYVCFLFICSHRNIRDVLLFKSTIIAITKLSRKYNLQETNNGQQKLILETEESLAVFSSFYYFNCIVHLSMAAISCDCVCFNTVQLVRSMEANTNSCSQCSFGNNLQLHNLIYI